MVLNVVSWVAEVDEKSILCNIGVRPSDNLLTEGCCSLKSLGVQGVSERRSVIQGVSKDSLFLR